MAAGRHLAFSETENFTIRSALSDNPTTELDITSLSCVEPRSYATLNFWTRCRLLRFGPTGSGAIRSADPENPTLEPNMKWIGWLVAEIWPFEIFHMAASRHRGFSYTESFAIRSAVPENPMTELDIMPLFCIESELCQFEFFDKMTAVCHFGFC